MPKTLIVRNAVFEDVDQIRALTMRVYPQFDPYTHDVIRGQISNFPEGQFVTVYDGEVVGYCATIRVAEQKALSPHSWSEISGDGYATTHDINGDYLYGIEVCVDLKHRNLRIGHRLYKARKALCQNLRLKGIVCAGRMSGMYRKSSKGLTPEMYLQGVIDKKIRDQVLNFQLRQGFDALGILQNYLPEDTYSKGFGVHLIWRNPQYETRAATPKVDSTASGTAGYVDRIRVATVQYGQRPVSSFQQFQEYVRYFVDVVATYDADFVVFPELFTLQLLSIENENLTPADSIATLTKYTEPFKEMMRDLAVRYNVNIIGGSHPTRSSDNQVYNTSYVFLRQGDIFQQEKIHPTPNESYWWNIRGGDQLSVIPTDCGPIGVLICYDCEFPELARHLINQGAKILFVPFCTDERQSYLRVRYCAQARAVENQCYIVLSGNVGNLPGVKNMDIQYSQSCILTPCDFGFARDGIAADTTPNVETVAIADIRIDELVNARNNGTVQNLKNRRHDLYSLIWKK